MNPNLRQDPRLPLPTLLFSHLLTGLQEGSHDLVSRFGKHFVRARMWFSSTLFYPNPEKAAEWSSCGWDSYFCTIDVSVWVCPCVCVFVRKCQWCTCLSFYSQILDHTCWSWSLILWTIKALVLDIRLLEVFSLSSSFFSTWFCI